MVPADGLVLYLSSLGEILLYGVLAVRVAFGKNHVGLKCDVGARLEI